MEIKLNYPKPIIPIDNTPLRSIGPILPVQPTPFEFVIPKNLPPKPEYKIRIPSGGGGIRGCNENNNSITL